jgi:hypothetical protein
VAAPAPMPKPNRKTEKVWATLGPPTRILDGVDAGPPPLPPAPLPPIIGPAVPQNAALPRAD